MSQIIAITCPSGKQATALLPLLSNNPNYTLRLATHSPSSARRLATLYPLAEIHPTDLTSLSSVQSLLHNTSALIAIHPSLNSRELLAGQNLIDAAILEAKRPGNVFAHYICSTVHSTQLRPLLQHDLKARIEEYLYLSPLPCWTVLKPTNFMDAFPVLSLLPLANSPITVKFAYDPSLKNSVVALSDLAEAIAIVLNEGDKHFLAEYPLCSTVPLSDQEIMDIVGGKIGREIRCEKPTFEEGVQKILGVLFGGQGRDYLDDGGEDDGGKGKQEASGGDVREDLVRDGAERLVLFYNRRGLRGSPNVLRWLLGREPTSVEEWVEKQLKGEIRGRK